MKPGKLQEEEEMDSRTLLCLLQPVWPCTANGSALPEQQGDAGPMLCFCAQMKGYAPNEIESSPPGTMSHPYPCLHCSIPESGRCPDQFQTCLHNKIPTLVFNISIPKGNLNDSCTSSLCCTCPLAGGAPTTCALTQASAP